MLALRTGWTPDVIAELPVAFRAAGHWALYAESICGPEGLPSTDVPASAPQEQRVAMHAVRVQVMKVREILYPEDES